MIADAPKTADTVVRSWGLFNALGLLMLGNGLLGTLLGARAEFEGFSTATTGIVLAGYYVGFLAGSQFAPLFLRRVGHVRVFAALASLASAVALAHAVVVVPWVWMLFRIVTGFCLAGLYVVSESWLNDLATNETRGRLLSTYMVVLMGGLSFAQLLLGVADPLGFRLFVLASILVSLAVVPISLSIGTAPSFLIPPSLSFREAWRVAPVAIIGGLGAGMASGAVTAMGPVFAVRIGMSPARIGLFMALLLAGAVVLQWPIGSISDRVPRRRWLLTITILAGVAAFVTGELPADGWQLLAAVFVYGGLSFPLYSLSLSHFNDLIEPGQAVAASSVFVFVSGAGAIAGPLLGSKGIDVLGPRGLFWVVGLVHVAIGLFAFARILIRERPIATADQLPWIPVSVRSVLVTRLRSGRHDTPGGDQ